MRKFRNNQLLEVHWLDIVDDPDWTAEEGMKERPQADCYSVGYYHHQDTEFLYLSGTITESGERSKLTIPIGCIVTIHEAVSGRQMGKPLFERRRKGE